MSDREAVNKLLGLLMRYKKIIIFIMGCLIVSSGLNLCIPLLSQKIMDEGFIGGNKNLLIQLVLVSALLYGINAVIAIIKEKERITLAARLEYQIADQSFSHLIKLKPDYFRKLNYAELYSNIYADIGNITLIADEGMFYIITQVFSILGGVIGLFIINYKLAMLVLLFLPCKYFAMKYFVKRRKKYTDQYIVEAQGYAKWFGDSVGGIQEIKLFNIGEYKKREFKEKQESMIHTKKNMFMLGAWNNVIDSVMVQVLVMFIYLLGAIYVFNLELTIGSVFAFITYSSYVTSPISGILNIGYMLSGILPSTKRFFQFMNEEEEIDEIEQVIFPETGNLEFRDVGFSYRDDTPVFDHLNLWVEKGTKIALVGKNGCGKSTLIELLTRCYRPGHGNIMLNGIDIWKLSLQKYRELISLVSQQIYLFNDTILNNICLYKEIEHSKIMEAVKDSGLQEFIEEVTLDYIVGPNGSYLSGGQKQKIAIARALIYDKPIIIFDEATANADRNTETQINQLLQSNQKGKTIILVSHKLDILPDVDSIIFFKESKVVQGSYEDLCRNDREFAELLALKSL